MTTPARSGARATTTEAAKRRAKVKRALRTGNGHNGNGGFTDLAKFARTYSDDFLRCRYPNHFWERTRVANIVYQGERLVVVEFECHCGAQRTDYLFRDGQRAWSTSRLPAGYVVKGAGRVTDRSVWRKETVRRALQEG